MLLYMNFHLDWIHINRQMCSEHLPNAEDKDTFEHENDSECFIFMWSAMTANLGVFIWAQRKFKFINFILFQKNVKWITLDSQGI